VREAGVHPERDVGAAEELLHEDEEGRRRALTAVLRADGQGLPSRLVELGPSVLETVRCFDDAVLELAPFAIADRVERAEDVARELVGLLEDHGDLVGAPSLEGSLAERFLELELLEEQEAKLAEVGLVAVLSGLSGGRHGRYLLQNYVVKLRNPIQR
jgi:hypothetical protein